MTDKVLDKFFNHLMKCEGWDKVTNDPDDPGGLTKYGISKKAYPNEDIANLTLERAKELFRRDYWKVCFCDILPDCLSVVVCDTAYNCGTVTMTGGTVIANTADFGGGACNAAKTNAKLILNG